MRHSKTNWPLMLTAILTAAVFCLAGCSSAETSAGNSTSAAETLAGNSASAANASAESSASAADASAESAAADDGAPIYADIEIEGYGTVTVELDPASAPKTVENFVNLANSGFYDGLTFHRIMEGFMMQGGDPAGNGTGGSDEQIVGEFSQNGYSNLISHVRGTISMARSQDFDSGSSQFFIVQGDSLFLDGAYAGFGHVADSDSMAVVDAICAAAEPIDSNGTIAPEAQPVITTVKIHN